MPVTGALRSMGVSTAYRHSTSWTQRSRCAQSNIHCPTQPRLAPKLPIFMILPFHPS